MSGDELLAEGPWNLRLPEETLQRIRQSVRDWSAGRWAEESSDGPACVCGLAEHYTTGNRGYSKHGVPSGECQRHPSP